MFIVKYSGNIEITKKKIKITWKSSIQRQKLIILIYFLPEFFPLVPLSPKCPLTPQFMGLCNFLKISTCTGSSLPAGASVTPPIISWGTWGSSGSQILTFPCFALWMAPDYRDTHTWSSQQGAGACVRGAPLPCPECHLLGP